MYEGRQSPSNSSNELLILNTPPTIELISPLNDTSTTNRTPLLNWTAYDPDEDDLTYDINITCEPACPDDRNIDQHNIMNYTTSMLEYFADDGFYYKWSARAYDGEEYSNWTEERILHLDSLVIISLEPETLQFGHARPGDTNSTINNRPEPISINNEGNCYINVSMQGEQYLWDSMDYESDYHMFKTERIENESFKLENSITQWTNFTLQDLTLINQLNFNEQLNKALLHFNITVPSSEPTGEKIANFTIGGRYVSVN